VIVVDGIDRLEAAHGRLFVVLGVFDGLHLGHLYMLRELHHAAEAHGARPAVITFDHHPDEILTGSAPPLICDPEERRARLAAAGVAVTVVLHFDHATRNTPYDEFVDQLRRRVDLAGFLMTHGSAFGYERGGTPETVAALGRQLGFDVVVVPTLELDGRPVRSAEIRADIAAGDLAGAARLLGRPYAVVGSARASDDGGRGEDSAVLSFAMPVALPPRGTYEVELERVSAGEPSVPRRDGTAGRLRIEEGRATIDAPGMSSGRYRFVFERRQGE
jgi:riboflavin kinase/FMN adenylyltransferase